MLFDDLAREVQLDVVLDMLRECGCEIERDDGIIVVSRHGERVFRVRRVWGGYGCESWLGEWGFSWFEGRGEVALKRLLRDVEDMVWVFKGGR